MSEEPVPEKKAKLIDKKFVIDDETININKEKFLFNGVVSVPEYMGP